MSQTHSSTWAERQQMDDPRARRVGEHAEDIRDPTRPVRAERPTQQRRDGVRVEAFDRAGILVDGGGE